MQSQLQTARAYESNGQAISAKEFVAIACHPQRSVVVEACAGSGKTWLLVARMLRLLLAGAAPSELLAITFTRKAAQEMRERLLQLLEELAVQPEDVVAQLLIERGIDERDLDACMPAARGLYQSVLSSSSPLSIDTFHSWFARLIQVAPLASGVPHGYSLTEASGELLNQAYRRFMQELNRDEHATVKQALLHLYELVGDWNAKRLLDSYVDKRAEWWAANQSGAPLQELEILCGADGQSDARLRLWDDGVLVRRLSALAVLLGKGAKRNTERAVQIESALTAGASLDAFAQIMSQFFDAAGTMRGHDHRRGKLLAAIEQEHGEAAMSWFENEIAELGQALLQLQRRSAEGMVLELNRALFTVGHAYLECYQEVKAEQRVFDFSDLEWQAYRLLTNNEQAAYVQSRLDARYKHVLLDEFQDTNPLQWSIVRSWLAAYGDDTMQPSVFIVGDPKQSIYRFRRAEPRVFEAARHMLVAQGANVLRTNQTRRNAQPIVDMLNIGMRHNPIYSAQTTLGATEGTVWRLPLIRIQEEQLAEKDAATQILRNPLLTPREEQEDARRYDEGRAVAAAIIEARLELARTSNETVNWSDVMLLVKKRAHLRAYENALREAGIPFISDKRGGLLDSLEVADLIALLSFLITPGDNLALAHVLKSPIIGADDADLILLAEQAEGTWWQRLQNFAEDAHQDGIWSHACTLLQAWLEAAPHLPVHDLLDLILHQGQLLARYAEAAAPMVRGQVIGNIEAFIELSLSLDAGRYPSLPKFIAALQTLRQGADSDAPDEASVDAGIDAVRILTIHSAKGLESPIVVMLDTNHSEAARDDLGILCEWPQDADAPTHFSAFGRKDERGAARDAMFVEEEKLKMQEDWNLLYVAATRAKKMLIVSGVAGTRNANDEGVVNGSWYARLLEVAEHPITDIDAQQAFVQESHFSLPLFNPSPLPAALLPDSRKVESNAIDEGIYLHALLERLTQGHAHHWPLTVPDAGTISRWLSCPMSLAAVVHEQAHVMLQAKELERFFNPAHYLEAHNEMEIAFNGSFLRYDRIVMFDTEIWILDYKRQLLDNERAAYRKQLAHYRQAGRAVYAGREIRTALITTDGRLWEMQDTDQNG